METVTTETVEVKTPKTKEPKPKGVRKKPDWKLVDHKCSECGKKFKGKAHQKTCSEKCRLARWKKQVEEHNKTWWQKVVVSKKKCGKCQKEFQPKTRRGIYCSNKCYVAAQNAKNKAKAEARKSQEKDSAQDS